MGAVQQSHRMGTHHRPWQMSSAHSVLMVSIFFFLRDKDQWDRRGSQLLTSKRLVRSQECSKPTGKSFRQWYSPNATWEPALLTVCHVFSPWADSRFFADLNKCTEAKINAGVSRGRSRLWLSSEAQHPLQHSSPAPVLCLLSCWFWVWALAWWFMSRFNSWSSPSLGLLPGLLIYAHDLFLTTEKTYSL